MLENKFYSDRPEVCPEIKIFVDFISDFMIQIKDHLVFSLAKSG